MLGRLLNQLSMISSLGGIFFVREIELTMPEDVNAMQREDKFRVNDFPVKQRPTESL